MDDIFNRYQKNIGLRLEESEPLPVLRKRNLTRLGEIITLCNEVLHGFVGDRLKLILDTEEAPDLIGQSRIAWSPRTIFLEVEEGREGKVPLYMLHFTPDQKVAGCQSYYAFQLDTEVNQVRHEAEQTIPSLVFSHAELQALLLFIVKGYGDDQS